MRPPSDSDDTELPHDHSEVLPCMAPRVIERILKNMKCIRIEALRTLQPYMTPEVHDYIQANLGASYDLLSAPLEPQHFVARNDAYTSAFTALNILQSCMPWQMHETILAEIVRVTVECNKTSSLAKRAAAVAAPYIPTEAQPSRLITRWEELSELMGGPEGGFFGPDFLGEMRGIHIPSPLPQLRITEIEAINAKRLGHIVSLHTDRLSDGAPSTMLNLHSESGMLAYSAYQHEVFMNTADVPEWRETSPDLVPGTVQENYLQQTVMLISYLENEVSKNRALTPQEQEAVDEYKTCEQELVSLMTNPYEPHQPSWRNHRKFIMNYVIATRVLAHLKITRLIRPTPPGILNDLINAKLAGIPMLTGRYTATSGYAEAGAPFVGIGSHHGSSGLNIITSDVHDRIGDAGAVFSRRLSPLLTNHPLL